MQRFFVLEEVSRGLIGHFGDDFYKSYDQTNSVKALKEASWLLR